MSDAMNREVAHLADLPEELADGVSRTPPPHHDNF